MAESTVVRRRLSLSVRNTILQCTANGMSTVKIAKLLSTTESNKVSRQAVYLFLKRYKLTGSITDQRPKYRTKLNEFHKNVMNMWLSQNSEITAEEIVKRLKDLFNLDVSKKYVCMIRKGLGWTTRRVKYCQLISNKNKAFRLTWCLEALSTRETFENVIFTDESTVEMSANGRLFFHKPKSAIQLHPDRKPKPKHSYKVHVWAGISYRGRTHICIFTGIMDSLIYQQILKDNFIPFVEVRFPDGYRLYQDNDSKHKSKSTKKWMEDNGMLQNVMETPASSPDLNPIENLWSSMKYFLETKVKPKTRDELVAGIKRFWTGVTAMDCARYIDHIHRVIPHVVLNEGGPSGF